MLKQPQNPVVFAEGIRRLKPDAIGALADCLLTVGLCLEYDCPPPVVAPDSFLPRISESKSRFIEKVLLVLGHDQSFLPEVNELLAQDKIRFLRVVTTTELVPL